MKEGRACSKHLLKKLLKKKGGFLDPRFYQITVLGSLLMYGIGWLNFDVTLLHIFTILVSALLIQYICSVCLGSSAL